MAQGDGRRLGAIMLTDIVGFTNTKQEAPHFRAGRNATALSKALFARQSKVSQWLNNDPDDRDATD